jgi:PKD repeat protein
MKIKGGVILIIIVFLITFVSANFQIGNPSHFIKTQYGPSENISGWINISLKNESGGSLFRDSYGNSIMLLELIKNNKDFGYSCNTKNCSIDYPTEGESNSLLSFTLDSGQQEIIGIKLNGYIGSISSLTFELVSDAPSSCHTQLEVDLLNDKSIDIANKKKSSGNNSCASLFDHGCFDSSKSSNQYVIGAFPSKHCQKINLSSSPGFKIGAWVNNSMDDPRTLIMELYDINMEAIEGAKCNLSNVIGIGNASCEINYFVEEPSPYFVCIYSDQAGFSRVRGYGDKLGCGFYQGSAKIPEEDAAFDIFSQGLAFDSVDKIILLNSSEETMNKIREYIYNRYGSYDCNENNCIIPISINSNINQNIVLKNLKLNYVTNMGGTSTNEFYSIEEAPPKITSEFQRIYLDYGNFSVSKAYGKKEFSLKLDNENIFSEEIEIKNLPKIVGVSPTTVPSFIPVVFTVSTNQSKSIASYTWDFNDSTPIQNTTTNETTHTYNHPGTYQIKIGIRDTDGIIVSKTFEILATISKSQIQSELEKDLKMLETTKNQITSFDSFIQEGLNSALNISELERNLKNLQVEYNFASSEENYTKIGENLSKMNIPELITVTKNVPSLPFYPLEEQIDLETLKNIGGGEYIEQKEDYKNAILGWQINNTDVRIGIEEFSALIRGDGVPILTEITITVKKNYSERSVYLFVKKIKDLKFKERYFEKESGDYFYWELGESDKKIEFLIPGEINFEEIPAFISPEINALSIEPKNVPPVVVNLKKRWGIIIFSLIILLFIALIIYSLLSVWYKRRYESYLFKNRNDLYNLISYTNVSKGKGEKEAYMRMNLTKAGWTGEQVSYVLKKYSGRRTGMIELPLTKLIDRLLSNSKKPNPQPVKINPAGRRF